MNKDTIKGDWKQLSGKIQDMCSELSDDDIKQREGSIEYLLGKLQVKYGLEKDKAKQQLKDLGL
jgi:uncharacterized protein YjbJ (UPF0337 family)